MNRLLARVWNSRYGKYLCPLSFCIGNLINILLFYLGLAYTDNAVRDVVFIIGNVLFTLVAAVALLSVLRFGRMKCRTLLPLGIVLLFYMVCYLMVPLRHGFTSSWIHSAGQFAFFSFPAFCAGIYAAVKQQEETLFASLERLGLYNNAFPAGVGSSVFRKTAADHIGTHLGVSPVGARRADRSFLGRHLRNGHPRHLLLRFGLLRVSGGIEPAPPQQSAADHGGIRGDGAAAVLQYIRLFAQRVQYMAHEVFCGRPRQRGNRYRHG